MTIEIAIAAVIAFSAALVQASRRSILSSGQLLGPIQIGAAMVCASLVPALAVYTLQFHTAWALGLDLDSPLLQTVSRHGFVVALVTATALFALAALAFAASGLLLLSGRAAVVLVPAGFAAASLLVMLLRGSVGGRFSGEQAPPALTATVMVLFLLVAAIVAASRLDADIEL